MSVHGAPCQLEPEISEAVEALRATIGVPLAAIPEPYCYEASRDAVRHFSYGIGDDNPLWCDPQYAEEQGCAALTAPPTFLFATSRIASGATGGMPGFRARWAGCEWTWHRPLFCGDAITTTAQLQAMTRVGDEPVFRQTYKVSFFNQRDEMIAVMLSHSLRMPREMEMPPSDLPVPYEPDDLAEVYTHYAAQERRGAKPLYWEDIRIGDTLPVLAKGPVTVTGLIAFLQGWGGLSPRTDRLAWLQVQRNSTLAIPNRLGIPETPERSHWDGDFARASGLAGAYAAGPARASWMVHQVTDWMGDGGRLRNASCALHGDCIVGDAIFIAATVTGKAIDHAGAYVTIEQRATTRTGALSATGSAVVELLRRV